MTNAVKGFFGIGEEVVNSRKQLPWQMAWRGDPSGQRLVVG